MWRDVWSAADAHHRLKGTDHAFLARYCALRAHLERMLGQNIAATIKTVNVKKLPVTKTNPAFSAMLQMQTDVSAMEERLGLNPRARADLYQRIADARDPGGATMPTMPRTAAQTDTSAPSAIPIPPKPASPLNLLAATRKH